MRGWRGALLLGAALIGAAAPPAQGRSARARLLVGAQVLPNCLLQVRAVSARPLVSVKLRCGQVTVARVGVEPDAPLAGAPRPWSAAMTVADTSDPFEDTRWVANRRFLVSSEGVWTATLDDEEGPAAPRPRRVIVRVDF